MCFVSLNKPNLEIIGFGMFFALHIMMGISMLKTLFQKTESTKNPETDPMKKAETRFKKIKSPIDVLNNIKILLKNYILIGKISIVITIILVFVAFIMLFITFRALKVRHKVNGIEPKADFIPEPDQYKGSTEKPGYEYRGKEKYGKETWKYGYYMIDGVDYFMNDNKTKTMKDKFKNNAISITVLLWVIYNTILNSEISEYIWPRVYFMIFAIATLPMSILFSIIYNFAKVIGKTENGSFSFLKNFGKFKQYNQLYSSVFIKKEGIFKSLSNLFNRATTDNVNTSDFKIIQLQTFILSVVMLVLSSINIWLAEKIAVRNNAIPDPNKIMRKKPSVAEDDKRLSEDRTPKMEPIYVAEYKDYETKNECPSGTIKTVDNKNGILECIPDQRMSLNNFNNWTPPPSAS
jgi:hypothetical protein